MADKKVEPEGFKYKIKFINGETKTLTTHENLIKYIGKQEHVQRIMFQNDEWMINYDNVLWIENTTPEPETTK